MHIHTHIHTYLLTQNTRRRAGAPLVRASTRLYTCGDFGLRCVRVLQRELDGEGPVAVPLTRRECIYLPKHREGKATSVCIPLRAASPPHQRALLRAQADKAVAFPRSRAIARVQ
jgi:hypothetical protein